MFKKTRIYRVFMQVMWDFFINFTYKLKIISN